MDQEWTDTQRAEFIEKLDESFNVRLTAFESSFVSSNVAKFTFSSKQRPIIDGLIKKYRDKIKW